jgi:hypothetical protein
MLCDEGPQDLGVERFGESKGPHERPSPVCGFEAPRVGMDIRPSPGSLRTRIRREHPVGHHHTQQVDLVGRDPAAYAHAARARPVSGWTDHVPV